VEQIRNDFLQTRDRVPIELRVYWPMRAHVVKNVPFKGHKMLIPSPLRKIVLEGLHAAHQEINGMLPKARERFFWPGLDAAIRLTRA